MRPCPKIARVYGWAHAQRHYEVIVAVGSAANGPFVTIDPASGWRARTWADLDAEWSARSVIPRWSSSVWRRNYGATVAIVACMSRTMNVVALLATVLAIACASKQQPASQTTTRTETKTENNTGESRKDVKTETTVDQPDGSQTTTRTDQSTHTVPPAPAVLPATPPMN
jgi:hypothetical protein